MEIRAWSQFVVNCLQIWDPDALDCITILLWWKKIQIGLGMWFDFFTASHQTMWFSFDYFQIDFIIYSHFHQQNSVDRVFYWIPVIFSIFFRGKVWNGNYRTRYHPLHTQRSYQHLKHLFPKRNCNFFSYYIIEYTNVLLLLFYLVF